MASVSYARHQFPPVIIQHAVWLYLRISLSYRDVEDLLAERGLDVSYETVRRCAQVWGAVRKGTAQAPSPPNLTMAPS
jgi:transposase-like protein